MSEVLVVVRSIKIERQYRIQDYIKYSEIIIIEIREENSVLTTKTST